MRAGGLGRLSVPRRLRAGARLAGDWFDLAWEDPDGGFDPVGLDGGKLGLGHGFEGHQETYVQGIETHLIYDVADLNGLRVAQGGVFVRLGRDDDAEVVVRVQFSDWFSLLHQPGPMFGVDPQAAEDDQLGVALNFDASLFAPLQIMYAQNVFRCPAQGDMLNPAHYTYIAGGCTYEPPLQHSIVDLGLRCRSGQYQITVNGVPACMPQDRPAWTEGRDGWGFRCLSVWSPVGELWFDPLNGGTSSTPATHVSPVRVPRWYAAPYAGTLAQMV